MEESAWQRGKRQTSELANGQAIKFMIACTPIYAVGGVFLAPALWWPLRLVVAVLIGFAVTAVALLSISGYYALRAPYRQRKDARDYARALETHVHEFARWARRREIADDFRRETLEHVRSIADGNDPRRAAELDHHWRTIVAGISGQLREYGADDNAQAQIEIRGNLAALDAKEDGYGDDEVARVRNSMAAGCQNVWSAIRSEAPPTAPAPPGPRAGDQ